MAFALPTSADQQTLSGKFFDVLINGTIKGLCTNFEATDNDRGDFVQCVGEDSPRNNPDTRFGDGSLDNLVLSNNDVTDILLASGDITSGQAATGDVDLRFPECTIAVMYNDSVKKYTRTFLGCYIRSRRFTVTGNRLATDQLQFQYLKSTLSYS